MVSADSINALGLSLICFEISLINISTNPAAQAAKISVTVSSGGCKSLGDLKFTPFLSV